MNLTRFLPSSLEVFLFFVITILAFSQPVGATWYCDGWLNDCGSTYPKECCATASGNVIPVCIKSDYVCKTSSYCCTGGGCDSYDDLRFCSSDYPNANCNVINDGSSYDMACCPDAYPVWSEEAQRCWKAEWECTSNIYCESDETCQSYNCITLECDSNYKLCEGNFVVEMGFEPIDNACKTVEISRYECRVNEYCLEGSCVELQCDDAYWTCDDYIRVEMGYFTENHECVLKETGETFDCGIYQSCTDGECYDILCDDNDNCTTDHIVERVCVNTFNDADSDTICDFYDACPSTFGSGVDGCPFGEEIGDVIVEDYGVYIIPVMVLSSVILLAIVYIVILRRRPKTMYRQ